MRWTGRGDLIRLQIREWFTHKWGYFGEQLLKKVCVHAQTVGGPTFVDLRGGENLNQNVIKIVLQLISEDETVQLIIYEALNGNLDSLCLALSQVDMGVPLNPI